MDLFLGAFQEVRQLAIGELWAIPAMLRLGLIESVRRMALRTVRRLEELESADQWAGLLADQGDRTAAATAALHQFVSSPPPLTPTFVARLLAQLRAAGGAYPPLLRLEYWIADHAMHAEEAAARANERVALTQIIMANSITSLRGIARMDWESFVERQSAMEAVLRRDPGGVYAGMTFETRDQYRHVVERIAKRTRKDERAVAQMAVDLAVPAAPPPILVDAQQHAGLLAGSQHGARIFQARRQRLLAQHVQPTRGCGLGLKPMQMRGRGDVDEVKLAQLHVGLLHLFEKLLVLDDGGERAGERQQ